MNKMRILCGTILAAGLSFGAATATGAETPMFAVRLGTPEGSWRPLPVERFMAGLGTSYGKIPDGELKEFDGIREGIQMTRAAHCEFFWERPVEVCVTAPGYDGELELSSLGPVSVLRKGRGEIIFRLDRPDMLLVRKGRDYLHGLSLYARPMPATPDASAFRNVIRFKAGFHRLDDSPYIHADAYGAPVVEITRNDTLVVLEPGAVVEAAFDVRGARHVEICGGGRIDLRGRLPYADSNFAGDALWAPFRKGVIPAIYMHGGAENLLVRDISIASDFRGINARNARGLTILDTGVFTSVTNGDGLNFISSEDIVCRRLYIRSQDDSFCAYNACDSIPWLWDEGCVPRPTRNICLSDSLLASNARAIVLGGHGLSMRGGANVLENVEVSHCRILGNVMPCEGEPLPQEHRLYWSGIFRLLSQSGELVRNLRFRDIAVEWVPGYLGSAFHIDVRRKGEVSYSEKSAGWRIEDVSFRDIAFAGVPAERTQSVFKAPPPGDDGTGLHRISFENVTFDGVGMDEKLATLEKAAKGVPRTTVP